MYSFLPTSRLIDLLTLVAVLLEKLFVPLEPHPPTNLRRTLKVNPLAQPRMLPTPI